MLATKLVSVCHHIDPHMGIMASEITDNLTAYSKASSGLQQNQHKSSASLALCEGEPALNSPHKGQ